MTQSKVAAARSVPMLNEEPARVDSVSLGRRDDDLVDSVRHSLAMNRSDISYEFERPAEVIRLNKKEAAREPERPRAEIHTPAASGDRQNLKYEPVNFFDEGVKAVKTFCHALHEVFQIVKADLSPKGFLQGAAVTGALATAVGGMLLLDSGSLAVAAAAFSPPILLAFGCGVFGVHAMLRLAEYVQHALLAEREAKSRRRPADKFTGQAIGNGSDKVDTV